MKKLGSIVLLLAMCWPLSSHAALIDNGDGTVTDDTTNLMWLKDANYAYTSGYWDQLSDTSPDFPGGMNWDDAIAWADGLSFAEHDDWRLPTTDDNCAGLNCTGSEMGYLYYTSLGNPAGGPLTNTGPFGESLQSNIYRSGTEYASDPAFAWAFGFNSGGQAPYFKSFNSYNVWAVREVTAVPEPASLLLLGTGLMGVMKLRRKKRC